jgi:hypothetical protein
MRRFVPCSILLALVLGMPAAAATSVSVAVTVGHAPPPPAIVFRGEPRLTIMPQTDLGYFEGPCDYDYFHYGSFFYIYNGGYWYRSPRYRGPFVVIRESYVPTIFYGLRDRGYHWRHGWRTERRMERREGRQERREEHGQHGQHGERGHGHGRDKD